MRLLTCVLTLAFVSTAYAAPSDASSASNPSAIVALFIIVAAVAFWFALRTFVRSLRAGKTKAATGGDFTQYALAALVNAAKLDGRVNDAEKRAIVTAMRDMAGEAFEAANVEAAFASAKLNKDELVAFLASQASSFTRDQKAALLKALVSVFVSDGKFDESEHAALVDYTAAVGFDRQNAPDMLRGIARSFQRGSIT